MTLATVQPDGSPNARMVLLKEVDDVGFVFTTSASPRTEEMRVTPQAALAFYWTTLERQVRVLGNVAEMDRENSARMYGVRPHEQRLALLTFPQSKSVPNRDALDEQYQELQEQFAHEDVPLPDDWGAWRVTPTIVEFWQGGVNSSPRPLPLREVYGQLGTHPARSLRQVHF